MNKLLNQLRFQIPSCQHLELPKIGPIVQNHALKLQSSYETKNTQLVPGFSFVFHVLANNPPNLVIQNAIVGAVNPEASGDPEQNGSTRQTQQCGNICCHANL